MSRATPVTATLDPYDAELLQQKLPRSLQNRLAYLRPHDRALVELLLVRQLSRTAVARLIGCPPGTVSRRLYRLSIRLHNPLVIDLLEDDCPLPSRSRQIAIEHFLHGLSQNELIRRHRLSRNRIARTLDYVRGWHQRRHAK